MACRAACSHSVGMVPSNSTMNATMNAPGPGPQMPSWRELVMAEPMPTWLRVAGAALIVLMLVCFYRVVDASVQHARQQHHSAAVQADARSYCRSMPDARDRDSCAAQLGVALAEEGTP